MSFRPVPTVATEEQCDPDDPEVTGDDPTIRGSGFETEFAGDRSGFETEFAGDGSGFEAEFAGDVSGFETEFASQEEDYYQQFWTRVAVHAEFVRRFAEKYPPIAGTRWDSMSEQQRIESVINTVEDEISDQLEAEEEECFVYPSLTSWENVRFHKGYGLLPTKKELKLTRTYLRRRNSAKKYSLILLTLYKIRELCIGKTFATRRDLYYQNVNDYSNQGNVDECVNVISAMFSIPRIHLRLLATSKGLVAGSLSMVNAQGADVDLRSRSDAEIIPQDVRGIRSLTSEAKFVLVVEKDATFQNLIDDNFLHAFDPCIILTGKGVPDLNTRQFLHLLWTRLQIPIFALVDCDPYGVEIMCTYRFGSLTMTACGEFVAVPVLRWLGVHPTDFTHIPDENLIELTTADKSKLNSLLQRPYLAKVPQLKTQLDEMMEWNCKAEIQAFSSPGQYVREKIVSQQWV